MSYFNLSLPFGLPKSLSRWIFPEKIPNRSIKGILVFKNDRLVNADARIAIYTKNFFGGLTYLGKTITDDEGRFEFNYHWNPHFWQRSHEVVIAVVERSLPFAGQGFFYYTKQTTVEQISRRFPAHSLQNDIGTYELTYRNISDDPTNISPPSANEQPTYYYYFRFFIASLPEILKRKFIQLFQRWMTTERVQWIFDRFWKYPTPAPTPQNLIHELMNEITAVDYLEEGEFISWKASWEEMEFVDNQSFPTVIVYAKKENDPTATLQLDRIEIEMSDGSPKKIVRPTDSNISWAIYLARSAFVLRGEAEIHLAETHILPQIVGRAFKKYIKSDNPIFKPIIPHIGQMDYINWIGANGIVFGKGSVLEISALTEDSVAKMIVNYMKKKADYMQDTPRAPLNPHHYKAMASKAHYDILYDFFTTYIDKHREKLQSFKDQIYRWSECISSKLKAIPKIMENIDTFDARAEERLARCLTWLVHKTTFLHWAAHSRQQMLTDIRSASIGMRNNALDENGNFLPFGNTDPAQATLQVSIARILLNFKGDALLKNPYKDIDPNLLRRIVDNLKRYPAYYNDIQEMHMCTEI